MSSDNSTSDSKPSPEAANGTGLRSIKDSIELASKTLILLVGICYAIGLIVVNIHLGQYGVYSLSLLQLNYVMAGLWAVLPMIMAWLGVALAFRVITYETEQLEGGRWTTWNIFKAFLGAGAGLFGFYLALKALADYLGLVFSWTWAVVLLLSFLVSLLLLGLAVSLPRRDSYSTVLRASESLAATLFATAMLIFYLAAFARGPYKDIPSGIGGGRPTRVQFVVEPDNKPYLIAAGLKFSGQSNLSDPVDLILVTDKGFIFLPESTNAAVSVSNDIVKAVVNEE